MNTIDVAEVVKKETPRLVTLLKEMKQGLDAVRNKVQVLTAKVKEGQYKTSDGITYLEAKNLLLLGYVQSHVYYLLRKVKGLSIEGHPVVRSLVEIRLFLEKIRPIDKKMEYQIQKLVRVGGSNAGEVAGEEKKVEGDQNTEDLLKHRPNLDQLSSSKTNDTQNGSIIYRPTHFAPQKLGNSKMTKQDKLLQRKQKEELKRATQNPYMKELLDEVEEKPEEVKEHDGAETKEVIRYKEKLNKRMKQEENLFTRAPLTRVEKNKEKYLKKQKNGLDSLTDNFFGEIKAFTEEEDGRFMSRGNKSGRGGNQFNKRKRKH